MLRPKSKPRSNPLEVAFASVYILYAQAKEYHFNVTGPTFYGDHKTYDGIADFAIEWFDMLGERMKALEIPVTVCPDHLLSISCFKKPEDASSAKAMNAGMLQSLECISEFLNSIEDGVDNTTSNMLQELDAVVGKYIYFVRSSA